MAAPHGEEGTVTSALRGIFTPLITPISPDESPDPGSMARLVQFQIGSGVQGLWSMGTTSEFASFDESERAAMVEATVDAAAGRVPVIANVSDASTRMAIRHGRHARGLGVDAIAATPPYYYPHTQDELLAHYRAIRDAVDLPLLIYNIPQTVRVRVELGTATALAAEGTAVGIKDSQNDLEWFRQLALFTSRSAPGFALFAGTRHLIDSAVVAGATGAIPSIANAFPELCLEAFHATVGGDLPRAAQAERTIIEIESAAVAAGSSRNAALIGLQKAILYRRGVIAYPGLTAPLRSMTEDEMERAWERIVSLIPVTSARR
jgi:4-hydroxy-tetrahydrodipicolinate synthase